MGIQGLLPLLKPIAKQINIKEYSGCTVAIDTYCWLHKGAFSCADKLARGESTDQYVTYCLKYVNMLLSFNIKPILVFDGRNLPAKADTEKNRREKREANRKKAAELLRLDRTAEARSFLQRCVDVTHDMALTLIKKCRSMGVDCIVAPYEADAQLAFLNISGIAHIIITEDSDLLLFGCTKVLFKMDHHGNGLLVEQEKLPLAMKMHPDRFTMDKFRYMCILSGCDYLPSLPGIGLVKACKFIKRTEDSNIARALTRLGSHLNMSNLVVGADYPEKFLMADSMFKHQPVFDPMRRQVVPMTPLPPGKESVFTHDLSQETSYQLALGNLNPSTLEKVDSWSPDNHQTYKSSGWNAVCDRQKSIWHRDFQVPQPLQPKPDPRTLDRPSTLGAFVVQSVEPLAQKMNIQKPTASISDNTGEALTELENIFSSPPPKKSKFETPLDLNESRVEDIENFEEDFIANFTELLESEERESANETKCRNPFSKATSTPRESGLEKMTKIKRTDIDENNIVCSRFFSSESPERITLTDIINHPPTIPSSEEPQPEPPIAQNITNIPTSNPSSFISLIDSLSKAQSANVEKKPCFKWSATKVKQTSLDKDFNAKSVLSPKTPKSSKTTTQPAKCVGLKRKKPAVGPGQPSIFEMFAFQPKAKLKPDD